MYTAEFSPSQRTLKLCFLRLPRLLRVVFWLPGEAVGLLALVVQIARLHIAWEHLASRRGNFANARKFRTSGAAKHVRLPYMCEQVFIFYSLGLCYNSCKLQCRTVYSHG